MTMQCSPISIKGVHAGLFLPDKILATSVASRPTVLPLASTMTHLRFSANPLPLGKYVLITPTLIAISAKMRTDRISKTVVWVKFNGENVGAGGVIVASREAKRNFWG